MSDKTESQRIEEFAQFLQDHYKRWAADNVENGEFPSKTQFARYLKVKQPTFSSYLNKTRLPTQEIADRIATKLGIEVYAILGMAPRMPNSPDLIYISQNYPELTADQQKQLVTQIKSWVGENEEKRKRAPLPTPAP